MTVCYSLRLHLLPNGPHGLAVQRVAVVLLLLCLSLTPLGAQTNRNIRRLQQQSTALKKQIKASEQLLRTTKKDVNTQLNNLAVINTHIEQQQKLVNDYQAEVLTLSNNIGVLQSQLNRLRADLQACKDKYRRTLLYMNRNRLLQNKWTFIFTAKDFRQMYRRMRYAAAYSKFLRAQGEAIRRAELAVQAKQDELNGVKRDKDALLSDARSQHVALEGQKAERQGVIDDLNKKQRELQNSIAQQRRKQAAIDARVDRLIQAEIAAAEARRKRAEAARRAAEARRKREAEAARRAAKSAKTDKGAGRGAGKSTPKPTERPASGRNRSAAADRAAASTTTRTAAPRFEEEEDATDRTLSSGFRANHGRLPVPITGSYAVTSRYGQYNVEGLSGVTLDSKGVNFTGRRGAQARCVYNGEVTAVANIGGSYIVIVRHGGYYSVYSNLSSVSVRNGQNVATRQVLGTVAPDASGNATLHFQLRQRSGNTAVHVNPLPWIAR